MDLHSHLSNAEPAAIEAQYRQFLADPNSVDPTWRYFFLGFDFAQRIYGEEALESGGTSGSASGGAAMGPKEFRVINLIHAYRTRGHLFTKTNPVRARRDYSPDLSIAHFGLEEADLDTVFEAGSEVGIGAAPFGTLSPTSRRPTATRLASSTCTSASRSAGSGSRTTLSWPTGPC